MEFPNKRNTSAPPALTNQEMIHIVSRLPFKQAARTSILSKNLQRIWLFNRRIDLDETEFTLDEKRRVLASCGCNSLADGIKRTGRRSFIDITNRFMASYRGDKMDTFRLRISEPMEFATEIESWVQMAGDRGVEEIEFDFTNPDKDDMFPKGFLGYYRVPKATYCIRNTLRSLRLTRCMVDIALVGDIRSLRSVSIAKAEINNTKIEILLLQCPNLTELELIKCKGFDELDVNDRNGHLRTLRVENCIGLEMGLTIKATGLEKLMYSGRMVCINIEHPHRIEEVELDFGEEAIFSEYGDLLSGLLVELYRAKVLTVCSYFLQVLPSGAEPLKLPCAGHTLKHLNLRKISLQKYELYGVTILLRSLHMLESITIELGQHRLLECYGSPFMEPPEATIFWHRQLVPFYCLQKHLRKVTIKGFKGQENEQQFLKFILQNASVLQVLMIYMPKDSNVSETTYAFRVAAYKLLNWPKASSAAQIIIG